MTKQHITKTMLINGTTTILLIQNQSHNQSWDQKQESALEDVYPESFSFPFVEN